NPKHRLLTNYKYNSLNQLVYQRTPDGGESFFYYDYAGRLRFSENAKQRGSLFSYTRYDALGRIIEVGESDMLTENSKSFKERMNESAFLNDNTTYATHKFEITKTNYDNPIQSTYTQENLRGRISSVTYQDKGDDAAYRNASHYDYDAHGNVKTLYQENNDLASLGESIKTLSYKYDLISGNVNEVAYQKGKADQFFHKYRYDEDNRLTEVTSSDDNLIWETQAKYFYFLHGPLARTEIGHDQIQGVDYAYTKHGWLIGMNSNNLKTGYDLGDDGTKNGNKNGNFAQDAAGFSLGYYAGAYKPIGYTNAVNQLTGSAIHSLFNNSSAAAQATQIGVNLYNGNISHMVTAIYLNGTGDSDPLTAETASPNLMAYRYDQLNRIKLARSGTNTNGTWSFADASTAVGSGYYEESFNFDPMGNITALKRRQKNTLVDDFNYKYKKVANHITENRLYRVDDDIVSTITTKDYEYKTAAAFDANDATTHQYTYDNIGNLIADKSEQIADIKWTVYGKVKSVTRSNGSTKSDLEFAYDAMGNRISKTVKPRTGEINRSWKH
ncbi:MAG: hypothetical protein NT150_00070, partial [Bacteroidetes bacterium]|nr:hypothetical protein [Bacteroidota bacterium]